MSLVRLLKYITFFMELVSFITGLLYWKKIKNSIWVWFVVYLGGIFTGEMICNYLSYTRYKTRVNDIYNYLIIPAEFLFLYWLYYKHAEGRKNKWLVLVCVLVYVTGFALNEIYFEDKTFIFDSVSYCIGNLVLLVVIINFFFQFSRSKEILNYRSSMIFWVSLGTLVFYLGTLPFFGLMHLLYDKYRALFTTYMYLMYVLDWAMYIIFATGFARWKPK